MSSSSSNEQEIFLVDPFLVSEEHKNDPLASFFPTTSELIINDTGIIPEEPFFNSSSASSNQTRGRDEDLAKIELAILSCIFIVTLLGNFIVILGIYFRRQKMSRMYYFILHLSIADLITAVFNVGTQFGMELTFPKFLGNNFLCKFVKFTQLLGPYSSSYVLVMTALDRYQAICFPLSNCTWTAKRSKWMLGLAWTISLSFSVPQIFIFSLQDVMGYPDCWASFPTGGQEVYVTWYAISFFIVPLFILIFAYSCICRTIWMNFNMKTAACNNETRSLSNSNSSNINNERTSLMNRSRKNPTKREIPTTALLTTTNQRSNHFLNSNSLKNVSINYKSSLVHENSWKLEHGNNVMNNLKNENTSSSSTSSSENSHGEPLQDSPESPIVETSSAMIRIIGGSSQSVKFQAINHKLNQHMKNERHGFIGYKWKKSRNNQSENPSMTKNQSSKSYTTNESIKRHSGSSTKTDKCNTKKNETLAGSSTVIIGNKSGSHKRNILVETQPRSSNIKGISRAKIKTIKLTVTVIFCYIFCSSPFIAAQLWVTYDPKATESKFYTGTAFTILTLLASLNSCVNPWIFLFFNPNLLQDFLSGLGCSKSLIGRFKTRQSGSSPVTQRTSPGVPRSRPSSVMSLQKTVTIAKHSNHQQYNHKLTTLTQSFNLSPSNVLIKTNQNSVEESQNFHKTFDQTTFINTDKERNHSCLNVTGNGSRNNVLI